MAWLNSPSKKTSESSPALTMSGRNGCAMKPASIGSPFSARRRPSEPPATVGLTIASSHGTSPVPGRRDRAHARGLELAQVALLAVPADRLGRVPHRHGHAVDPRDELVVAQEVVPDRCGSGRRRRRPSRPPGRSRPPAQHRRRARRAAARHPGRAPAASRRSPRPSAWEERVDRAPLVETEASSVPPGSAPARLTRGAWAASLKAASSRI